MEHWHTSRKNTEQAKTTLPSRILAPSSGNVQIFALDTKDGTENQAPFPPGSILAPGGIKPDLRFPIPNVKLGSNDQHAENLFHLRARRQQHHGDRLPVRRQSKQDRPYLQNPKYLVYRSRQRCDTGPDGKPVWDDRIEDSFQNALANIEPMGKHKKSQKGKPHGRNELISEWIFQETGERRSRKQVSSHIQVLNTLLKGISGWDALIKPSPRHKGERLGHEYYNDSIEHMVRNQRTTDLEEHYKVGHPMAPTIPFEVGSGTSLVEKDHLAKLSFEMWVSLPNQMDQSLHNYTRLQSSNSVAGPIPVEEIKKWRSSFPGLLPIIENWSSSPECDIILLEASFQLMSEFPPRHSKLGISLELDFLNPATNNMRSLAGLKDWTCVTHMYQHGKPVKETAHHDCHVAGVGKVKPFFESKWWASTFTQLTEKKKLAEDSKSDAAVELANESSRNFFRGLSVMQEISATVVSGSISRGIWTDEPPRHKRMAILLWKFSQAPAGFVGTTTWQKMIPPPKRTAVNSPSPMSEMGLPPLAMDTLVDGSHDTGLFDHHHDFLMQYNEHQHDMFTPDMDGELCHDGFMPFSHDELASFDTMHGSFDILMPRGHTNHGMTFGFETQSQELEQLQSGTAESSKNYYGMPQFDSHDVPTKRSNKRMMSDHEPPEDDGGDDNHQPLANFDVNTHRMLQVQLVDEEEHGALAQDEHIPSSHHQVTGMDDEDDDNTVDENDAFSAALMAASAMSGMDGQQQPYISTAQSFDSPLTMRPPLQAHHSFAGMGTVERQVLHHSKQDFAHSLANLQAFNRNQDTLFHSDNLENELPMEMRYQEATSRPHSQPTILRTHEEPGFMSARDQSGWEQLGGGFEQARQ